MVAGPGRAPTRAHNRHPRFTQQIPFCRKTQDRAIKTWFIFVVLFRRNCLDTDGSGPWSSTNTSTQQAHNKHTTEPLFVVRHRAGPPQKGCTFLLFFRRNSVAVSTNLARCRGWRRPGCRFVCICLKNVDRCRGWRSKKITRQAQNKHPRFAQQNPVLS